MKKIAVLLIGWSLAWVAGQAVAKPRSVLIGQSCVHKIGYCTPKIYIRGEIKPSTANEFHRIIETEDRRTGKPIRPIVLISSDGGDVGAAMQIGRDLRRTDGELMKALRS
jgi:hypothetical protein